MLTDKVVQAGEFDSTCDVEDTVVSGEGAVLPALTLPVDHDLHDLGAQRDVGGVDGHTGGGTVTRLIILTWNNQRRRTERKTVNEFVCGHMKICKLVLFSPIVCHT